VRELFSWAVVLVFYGFGLGVLQVPNPKRIIASKICFVLGVIAASGASIISLISLSDNLSVRLFVSFCVFGLIGAVTVEAIRFAEHTQKIEPNRLTEAQPQNTEKILGLEDKINKTPAPQLETVLIDGACGEYITEDNKKITAFTFIIEVTNLGEMSSVAKDWKMHIKLVDTNTRILLPVRQPKFTLGINGEPSRVLKNKDYLDDKTFNPIATGGVVRGFLVFFLEIPKELVNVKGTEAIILFKDSTGKDYKIIIDDFPFRNNKGLVAHIPGMEMKIEPTKNLVKKPRSKK
jgi:multisubunit Na+/H+ antiporter MnhG subunit